MLKTSFNEGDLVGIKLINGQEIVCKVIEDLEGGLVASHVRTVYNTQTREGELQSALVPFVTTGVFDGQLTIGSHMMVTLPFKLNHEMEEFYRNQISPIQLVQSGGIITN